MKGSTTEKLRERVKEKRRANQVSINGVIKGFRKGRVEPPIQINIEEHPKQAREPWPQKEE